MMRRVLLITYTFPPDNVPAAARPGQLFKYLPECGYQCVVVAANADGSPPEDDLVHRVPAGDRRSAVEIASTFARWFTRFCSPYEDRLSWVPYAAAAAADIIRSQPIEAIYSTSPFLAAHFAGLWLKLRYGLPWVADFQDPVRDNPFRDRRWIYPYDAIIERAFFRHADWLIANTDTVASAWGNRYPKWAGKISVLWNSYDPLDGVEPRETPPDPHRVLAHVGSMYGGRHPSQLLMSLERLNIGASTLSVKFVGPIDRDVLTAHGPLFERLQQKGVLTYGNRSVPRQEALRETAEADCLLLLDINEKNASMQMPSKLLDYVRFGKPILAYTPADSPTERILKRSGIPSISIDPSATEADGDRKLLEFLRIPTTPRPPSAWFEDTFNARAQARTVAVLFDKLLKERQGAKLSPCDERRR